MNETITKLPSSPKREEKKVIEDEKPVKLIEPTETIEKPIETENIANDPIQVAEVEKIPIEKPKSTKSKKITNNKVETEQPNENINPKANDKTSNAKAIEKSNDKPPIDIPSKAVHDSVKPIRKGASSALRSAALRPVSARPSAPRRRDRNIKQILHTENFVQEPTEQKNEKKQFLPEFDDADNIVITNAIEDNISSIDDTITTNKIENEIDGKQGHLVQQILETQTAILKADGKNDITKVFFFYLEFRLTTDYFKFILNRLPMKML